MNNGVKADRHIDTEICLTTCRQSCRWAAVRRVEAKIGSMTSRKSYRRAGKSSSLLRQSTSPPPEVAGLPPAYYHIVCNTFRSKLNSDFAITIHSGSDFEDSKDLKILNIRLVFRSRKNDFIDILHSSDQESKASIADKCDLILDLIRLISEEKMDNSAINIGLECSNVIFGIHQARLQMVREGIPR
ncbi:hypothetical protein KSP39_PZI016236 [Platanthera zijinensis]|uniref:Uncharacterized protein n=1 Tax=Platanthera zijinensis TaxID=2320716 RepID=A0AAP0B6T4_9ASPA